MQKEEIIIEIKKIIEVLNLWNEMEEHIFALGGELWETKYAEIYSYYETLVFKMIEEHFKNKEVYIDFGIFQEAIDSLAKEGIYYLAIDNEANIVVSSVEELYDLMAKGEVIYVEI